MANLLLKGIYKMYEKDVMAVKNFNLEINDKEFIVFVGPSGCGKSTILRMIAGLEDISEGEIHIDNKLVNKIESKDRDIAMVFQNYALYPHMSVYDNMAFSLKLKKTDKKEIEKKVKEASKILGIEHLLNRKPKTLSGGQKQRVAIGRAIVRNPKVFLMDEPLSNLDAKLRVQMRTEIIKLFRKLESTFIYVTHDQSEAMTMGTRIVVMNNGVIQQVDTPYNIYNNPNNIFVASFIGSPQMNFIEGTIKLKNKSLYAVFKDNEIRLSQEIVDKLVGGNYIGNDIIIGIRPEDISERAITMEYSNDNVIEGKIEVIELLGAESYIYANCNGNNLIIRVRESSRCNIGEKSKFSLNLNKFHIFDKESGMRIV